jgi:hypothetical protein
VRGVQVGHATRGKVVSTHGKVLYFCWGEGGSVGASWLLTCAGRRRWQGVWRLCVGHRSAVAQIGAIPEVGVAAGSILEAS